MKTTLATTATAGILLLALTGCGGGGQEAANLDGDWQLTSATDGTTEVALGQPAITLTVDGDQITGQAPCNGYGATLTGEPGTFEVDGIMGSMMACDRLDLEGWYFEALSGVDVVNLQGDTLTLESTSLKSILVFTSAG